MSDPYVWIDPWTSMAELEATANEALDLVERILAAGQTAFDAGTAAIRERDAAAAKLVRIADTLPPICQVDDALAQQRIDQQP